MQPPNSTMNLTDRELSWLPWLGPNGKLALAYSCFVNKSTYSAVEQTFQGIAQTRVQLLQMWANNHWDHLQSMRSILVHCTQQERLSLLTSKVNSE